MGREFRKRTWLCVCLCVVQIVIGLVEAIEKRRPALERSETVRIAESIEAATFGKVGEDGHNAESTNYKTKCREILQNLTNRQVRPRCRGPPFLSHATLWSLAQVLSTIRCTACVAGSCRCIQWHGTPRDAGVRASLPAPVCACVRESARVCVFSVCSVRGRVSR